MNATVVLLGTRRPRRVKIGKNRDEGVATPVNVGRKCLTASSPDFSHSSLMRSHSVFENLSCGLSCLKRSGYGQNRGGFAFSLHILKVTQKHRCLHRRLSVKTNQSVLLSCRILSSREKFPAKAIAAKKRKRRKKNQGDDRLERLDEARRLV